MLRESLLELNCNGPGLLRRLLLSGGVALLAACATPAAMQPGMDQGQVVAALGRPAAIFELPEGGQRFHYPQGGIQQQAWMLDFDRDGRLIANNQVHSDVFFAKVRIDQDSQQDVLRLLGPPAWTEQYPFNGLTGWIYPYAPNPMWAFVTTVMFDQAGIVRRVEGGPDPRFDRGSDRQ
jgi:hypothetical protein